MKKIKCDKCGKIHDPSVSNIIKFNVYPCEVEVCPACWAMFKKWAKIGE